MAEIHVQRRSSPSWPLILLALVVVLLLGWWFVTNGPEETVTLETPTAGVEDPARLDAPASPLTGWLDEHASAPAPGEEAGYVASGLRALADALESRAPDGQALADRAADLRSDAGSIADETDVGRLSARVRDAFQTAGGIIAGMRTHYPDIGEAATRVVDAASAVQADVPLERQHDAIRAFFERADDALARMAPAR